MKPARFEYHKPKSLSEALSLIAELEEVELLAGNQSLSILLSNRLAKPDHLVDLNSVEELRGVAETEEGVELGAMTTHTDIARSTLLSESIPVFPESAALIAGPSVRNLGTIGGSLAEADPAGNYPSVVTALDGALTLQSVDGVRDVSAGDFFVGFMDTDCRAHEVITCVTIPTDPLPPDRTGMAFHELKRVPHTWPKMSATGVVRVDDPNVENSSIESARICLGNATDVPLRVEEAERVLEGAPLTENGLEAAATAAIDAASPSGEMQAEVEYKADQVGVFTKRALKTAYERACAN